MAFTDARLPARRLGLIEPVGAAAVPNADAALDFSGRPRWVTATESFSGRRLALCRSAGKPTAGRRRETRLESL